MEHKLLTQRIASILCIFFAIAFLNPFNLLMTEAMHMAILGIAAAAFGVFAVLLLLESGGDERELAHRAFAGRIGFLLGGLILLLGITWQALHATLDPWLIFALCGMVAGKSVARFYAENWQ